MSLSRVGTCKHENISIADFLLAVGQIEELLINLIKLLLANIDAVDMQAILQSSTTGTRREQDGIVVEANVLRVDNLVGFHIL